VGRADELAALAAALTAAQGREATAVFVAGESGVGKSRLVAELERHAREAGARVLSGACIDLGDAELPYAPIVAALRALARDVEAEELERLAGPDRDELARLLPELGPARATLGSADPLAQVRLFEALLGLLARLGRATPVVLVVEDLQWADPSTRAFLNFLVRNARREALMLVATYRSDDLHRRHPLRPFLADIERAPGVERLELVPFTREELTAQLEAILDVAPERRLVDDLFERSQGNAFFAEELLAASRAGGTAVPATVRDALTLRVERLSEPTQRTLHVAAVAGASVGDSLLTAAVGLPREEVARALREALEHNVVVHDPAADGYAFRHALLREALYDDLLPGERAGLHRTLAQALESDERLAGSGAAAQRAFHWSGAHEPAAELAASIEAGIEAETLSAFTEANRHFERALELWDAVAAEARPSTATPVELLRRAAEAAHLTGEGDRSASLARRALAEIDAEREPVIAALVHERLGRYLWVLGQYDQALAAYRAAVALLPEEPSAERGRILAGEAHILMLDGDAGLARERAGEAIAVARAVGSAPVECAALSTLGAAAAILGARDEGIEHMQRALRLSTELGAMEEMVRAYVNLGELLDESGRLEESTDLVLEGWRRTRETLPSHAAILASEAASRLTRLGRWDEALEVVDTAEARPTNFFGGMILVVLARLETARGDLELADEHLEQVRRSFLAGSPGGMWRQTEREVAGALALACGRPQEARAAVADVLGAGVPVASAGHFAGPVYAVGVRAEADLAARARASGDETAERDAIARAAQLAEQARHMVGPDHFPLGPPPVEMVANAELAQLELSRARGSADPDAWGEHAERMEELGRPFLAAYARFREGEAAVEAGLARARAAAPLKAARETGARLGAQPLLNDVDDLARRARIDLGTAPDASATTAERLGLTPRELEVLRLVADGRTNAQIGGELYMSHKTASVHVSHILAKLDVRTRLEAATAAHRLGLLETDAAEGR
jgi:DNA-binding CsgD family transcriptional regulator/tetratricopeptide (TPR) repeat protein